MHRYMTWNGPMPTTGEQVSVTTGTNRKTMLQLSTPATRQIQLISWGFTIDDPPGADAIFELRTTDTAATVTAHVASGVQPLVPGQPASLLTLGASNTGYTGTAEPTPTAVRTLQSISMSSVSAEAAPVMTYTYQWMPDERPIIAVSSFVAVRAWTQVAAVDMRCFICWDE